MVSKWENYVYRRHNDHGCGNTVPGWETGKCSYYLCTLHGVPKYEFIVLNYGFAFPNPSVIVWELWIGVYRNGLDVRVRPFRQRKVVQGRMSHRLMLAADDFYRGFPKLYKVVNVASKGLPGEEQNRFRKQIASSGNRTHDPQMPC